MRIISFILVLLLLTPLTALANENSEPAQFDLSLDPGEVLFDLSNVKPGDSVSRKLTIQNNGEEDLNYFLISQFATGSKPFYNQLVLKIEDSNALVFEGKLPSLKTLTPRLIKRREQEEIQFHILIPSELGNEFQGKFTKFEINLEIGGELRQFVTFNSNYLVTSTALFGGGMVFDFYRRRKRGLN